MLSMDFSEVRSLSKRDDRHLYLNLNVRNQRSAGVSLTRVYLAHHRRACSYTTFSYYRWALPEKRDLGKGLGSLSLTALDY